MSFDLQFLNSGLVGSCSSAISKDQFCSVCIKSVKHIRIESATFGKILDVYFLLVRTNKNQPAIYDASNVFTLRFSQSLTSSSMKLYQILFGKVDIYL